MNIKEVTPDKVIQALKDKNVNLPCNRCGSNRFDFVSINYFPINKDPDVITIGGISIPSAVIACSNCGFLSIHALGPLGLI